MKLKSLLSVLCALLFLMTSMINLPSSLAQENTSEESITIEMLNKSNSFREKVGFSPQHSLTNKQLDPESKELYGVYLTTEEIDELNYRSTVIQAIKPYIEKLETINKDTFGGIYFDHKKGNGVLRIALVDDGINTVKSKDLLADFPHKDRLDLYNVKYSLAELIKAQEIISKIVIDGNWIDTSSEISIQENKVILYVKLSSNSTNMLLEKINSAIDSDLLVVKAVDDPRMMTALSRSDYFRPVFAGLTLEFPKGNCTSAASYKTQSGKYYISSAGHCGVIGQPVYQGGQFLGTVRYKKFGEHTDALFVGPLTRNDVNGAIYDEAGAIQMEDPWLVEGQVVCKSGITTGITCGPVRSLYAYGFVEDNDGTSVHISRLGSFAAEGTYGDSGSLVYYRIAYQGLNRASGILSGTQYLGENRINFTLLNNLTPEEFGIPIEIVGLN
ncbi:S1 family peptidase [Paenibacillus sp. FSL K6-2441]|uniref:S1 family peptidase n=1 Tax=Paenibacillus sp. FSL K6-2441 TaxID=2954679 RepID=UPI0030DAA4C9